MASLVTLITSPISSKNFSLSAINKNDAALWFQINSVSSYDLYPSEELRFLIVPSGAPVTDAVLYSYITNSPSAISDQYGIYQYQITNYNEDNISFNISGIPPQFPITNISWENTKFNLYWGDYLGTNLISSGNNKNSVYSLPHNMGANDVILSGTIIDQSGIPNLQCNLDVHSLTNDGSPDYPSNSGAYALKISYDAGEGGELPASGYTYDGSPYIWNNYQYFGSGVNQTGILFSLPLKISTNPNNPKASISPTYIIRCAYNSADIKWNNKLVPLTTKIVSADIKNNFSKQLDSSAGIASNSNNFKKVIGDEFFIPKESQIKKRLTVGVQDISVIQNVYQKTGTFVSNYTVLDSYIYSFSLKVDEYIPNYTGVNKYSVIKYFAEFGNGTWYPISPLSRTNEVDDSGAVIPKLIIFDTQPQNFDIASQISYLSISNTLTYRIKIVFNVTTTDSQFVPPEVRGYTTSIFNLDNLV